MAYRLHAEESIPEAVRRIAGEQVDKMLREIDDDTLGQAETVHQVRKRCKKVRALVRLVRPAVPDLYARENARFRDAARTLSDARDATALLETYDALMDHYTGAVNRRAFAPIRAALTRRRKQLRADQAVPDRIAAFRDTMETVRTHVAAWTIPDDGFATVRAGLKKTYRRGVKGLNRAYEDPSDAAFHEWRKRAKYHRYHCRLLRNLWQPIVNVRRQQLHDLTDYLGDDHDLAVLRQIMADEIDRFNGAGHLQAFLGLVDRRRGELQARAYPLGRCLYVEKPKHLVRRFGAFWDAWYMKEQTTFVTEPPETIGVAL